MTPFLEVDDRHAIGYLFEQEYQWKKMLDEKTDTKKLGMLFI